MNAINNINSDDLDQFARNGTLDNYQKIAIKSAIYPGLGTPLGINYLALKLNGEAGEFAEHFGKAMRDDDLIRVIQSNNDAVLFAMQLKNLTPDRREKLIKELGDCLWYISAIADELGLKLSDVALENLEKLKSRTERNVLQGSGDNR